MESKPQEIFKELNKHKKTDFKIKLVKNPFLDNHYLPDYRQLDTTRALVFHDFDLQTTQYWESCGTAATITQLRHLSPLRPKRLASFLDDLKSPEDQCVNDLFVHEFPPEEFGHMSSMIMDQMGGLLKIDQAWLFAETRNNGKKLNEVLSTSKSKLSFIDHDELWSERDIETKIIEIFKKNHIAELLIDGAFNQREEYPFPRSFAEWMDADKGERVNYREKPPLGGGPFRELEMLLDEFCNSETNNKDGRNRPEHQDFPCDEISTLLELLKQKIGPTPHVVVITGIYQTTPSGKFSDDEPTCTIFRVLDSNPTGSYTKRIHDRKFRSSKPNVKYMSARELWEHTTHLRGGTRLREWSTGKSRNCGANKVEPWTNGF